MANTDVAEGSAEPVRSPYLPDYRGQSLDMAFTDVVRQRLGLPMLVDSHGNSVRVTTLREWEVVHQGGFARSVVFEIARIR